MKQPKLKMDTKLKCDGCGIVDHAIIDGYAVGDRLLEGVKFILTILSDKVVANVHPDDADYFKSLNQKKWLKEVREFAEDENLDVVTCPMCGDDMNWPLFQV